MNHDLAAETADDLFCFNPHPARGPGESLRHADVERGVHVSIRTRPEGRVNLRLDADSRPRDVVSIRTRPEGRVNRSFEAP